MRAGSWLRALIKPTLLAVLLAVAPWLPTTSAECVHGSADAAKAMVERAVGLIDRVGVVPAFAAFMDPRGGFVEGDLYVFAIDFGGLVLVNGAWPSAIGSNALGARDARGRPFVDQMIRKAREHGEGWVQYEFTDPCTGQAAPKSSFVKRVGQFMVGVGFYGAVAI